jgi:uncharacterized protein (TIGR02145 family)
MKSKTRLFHLLFIAGLLFATFIACDKTNEPADDQSNDKLKDADGNVYKTVKIGSQVWMAENLKTTKYNDGTVMTNVTSAIQWGNLTTAAYCNYDNLESNATTYGRLYNWYAVNTTKFAPVGWHVPNDEDWTILENYLIANGYNYDGTKDENKIAKSLASTSGWAISDDTGTPGVNPEKNNSTGFTALPGGDRDENGEFGYIGEFGDWWSSTEVIEYNYHMGSTRILCYKYDFDYRCGLGRGGESKVFGNSVRLVKDN